jgi:hypothetical protein
MAKNLHGMEWNGMEWNNDCRSAHLDKTKTKAKEKAIS